MKATFVRTLTLIAIAFVISTTAFAQVEKATFHFDSFYFGYPQANAIRRVLSASDQELSHIFVNTEDKTADVYPDVRTVVDLYEIRKELRNADQAPKRIDVVISGRIADYAKVYSGSEVRPRKVVTTDSGQRFILQEGQALDALLASAKNGESVALEGTISGFAEKHLPIVVIRKAIATAGFVKSREATEPNSQAMKIVKSDA